MAKPVAKMTVKELKVELKERDLSTAGLKKDLLARLMAAIEEEEKGAPEEEVAVDEPMEEEADDQPMEEAAEAMDESPAEETAPAAVEAPEEELQVRGKRTRGDDGAPAPKKSRAEPEEEREASPAPAPAEAPAAAPAPADATNALVVEGLRRPFALGEIKDILGEHGAVEHSWISKNRSRCSVVFDGTSGAVSAWRALNGVTWPPKIGNALVVSFVSEETARAATDESESSRPKFVRRSASPPAKVAEPAPREPRAEAESSPRAGATPDDLFKKTSAKPTLYWMPVGEEEAKVNWENVHYDGHYQAKTSAFTKYPNRVA